MSPLDIESRGTTRHGLQHWIVYSRSHGFELRDFGRCNVAKDRWICFFVIAEIDTKLQAFYFDLRLVQAGLYQVRSRRETQEGKYACIDD